MHLNYDTREFQSFLWVTKNLVEFYICFQRVSEY